MSIQAGGGATSEGRRLTTLDFNATYTVLFSIYVDANITNDVVWGISGSTSAGSGASLGSRYDSIRGSSGGLWKLAVSSTGGPSDAVSSVTPSASTWYRVSARRTSDTSLILRVNGTDIATSSLDVSAREAVYNEVIFYDDNAGGGATAGMRISNYKSWSAVLSTAEIDAEHAATSFIVTANKFSGSPMGDASVLAGNDTADGSGNSWTLGVGLVAGANDSYVDYGGAAGHPIGKRLGGVRYATLNRGVW